MRIQMMTFLIMAGAGTAFAGDVDFLPFLLRPAVHGYLADLHADKREPGTDDPGAAAEFRLMTMKDEHGRIPQGAFLRAELHRLDNVTFGDPASSSPSIAPFSWISRGPQNIGGRTLAVLVHPSNNQILFAGSASGGIWKSTNAGQTWAPVNDFMASLYIGALVFDPLNPNTMYAGTGERFYDHEVKASGIFKSTDGGSSWTQLASTSGWSYVSAIAAQPGSSNVLVAAAGNGIYRTGDGGASWTLAGTPGLLAPFSAYSVAFNPLAGNRVVAGVRDNNGSVHPYYSSDGGLTFNAASSPSTLFGEIALAYAPSALPMVYAIVNGATYSDGSTYSELWRSTDNGLSYALLSSGDIGCADRRCAIWVSPTDSNLVVTGGMDVFRSTNGGVSFTRISNGYILTNDPHPDLHFIVGDPLYNGSTNRTVYFGTDGGVWRTSDILSATQNGNNWTPLNTTYQTAQFYGGAGHASGVGAYVGGTQDNGTLAVKLQDVVP
jgi:photosystem II stability/assembly factor-like uncharacterized protein